MADSRSTGRLQSSNAHRSMTRLNAGKIKYLNVPYYSLSYSISYNEMIKQNV